MFPNSMQVATHLRALRFACIVGLVLIGLGLTGIVTASQHSGIVKSILALGFVLSFAASCLLVYVRCPACGQRFTGSQAGGDIAPLPNPFATRCRYCGHKPSRP